MGARAGREHVVGFGEGTHRVRFVPDGFLDALTRSHRIAVRADLLLSGHAAAEFPDGLPLSGGTVTLDRTAEIRGHCDITIAGTQFVPISAFDPVTPFGAELQLWRGINLSTGPQLVSLGIFGIQDTKTDDVGGQLQITGLDRAQLVKDADFETTAVVRAGTNYGVAIQTLINAGVAGLQYRFSDVDDLTPLLVFDPDSDNRWASVKEMATSIGCDLYFDGDGACVLTPTPDPRSDPVAALTDGDGGVIVTASKDWSRDPAYNAVIAYSSNPANSGTPPRAVVRDLDPTSPTYYNGPFGKKPLKYSAPFTSQTQAINAATAKLRTSIGIAQSVDFSAVPNPALEPGDVVAVRRVSLGLDEVDVIDSLTIPLDASTAMSGNVRARQIVS